MPDTTISEAEMTGVQPQQVARPAAGLDQEVTISEADMTGGPAPQAPPKGSLLDTVKNSAIERFIGKAGRTVTNALVDTAAHPVESAKGMGKAVVGGVGQLASLAIEGVSALGRSNSWSALPGQLEKSKAETEALMDKIHVINTKPSNEVQSDMGELLGLLPGGAHAVGEDVYSATGSALAGAGSEALLTALMLKPAISGKVLDTMRVPESPLKAKVSTAFDELANLQPEKAGALVDHIKQADPAVAGKLKQRLRWNNETKTWEAKPMSEEQKAAVGEANAKATILEKLGKPVASIGTRADDVAGMWDSLHKSMRETYDTADEPVRAHALLDQMLSSTKDEAMLGLLKTLRAKVDNIPIHFVDTIIDRNPREGYSTNGLYDPREHDIQVVRGTKITTRVAVHELAHAATVRFMRLNEKHPLTQEINRLYEVAKQRAQRMDVDLESRTGAGNWHSSQYGLTNAEEFISESLSNPRFQQFLIDSEKFAGKNDRVGGIRNKIAELIQKVLGITDPKQARLLHNVFETSHELMAEQTKHGDILTHEVRKAMGNTQARSIQEDPFNPKMDAVGFLKGKIKEYNDQLQATFYPEGGKPGGKLAGAVIAKGIAEQMQSTARWWYGAQKRREFWNRNQVQVGKFISNAEKGKVIADPMFEKVRQAYRNWADQIASEDKQRGVVDYGTVDHYFPHLWKDPKAVGDWLNARFGSNWSSPGFTKDRAFDLYEEGIKAGFKPKYTNPEDIMLARQQASDIAGMKINILNDLEKYGLAVEAEKGETMPKGLTSKYPSPSGKSYWVAPSAAQILHNAFDSKTLWNMKGPAGDVFRGAMGLKNKIVPVRLALSLFHPLHVATIHNATAMTRVTKELLSGVTSPAQWLKQMTAAAVYRNFINDPVAGSRILRAYQGKLPEGELTEADRQSLQFMQEGGLIPEMSMQMRGRALQQFKDALQKGQARAAWHLPWAVMDKMQGVLFQHWIPSLKIASYLKDVESALKSNPELLANPAKRITAFRQLAKSVDNRYGEMAYNTLFWKRWVKDLAVSNTLSLGWQMGFLREYGGGAIDLTKVPRIAHEGGAREVARSGALDRPLFVTFYTTQALMYGGLLTYALTGKPPSQLLDYVYPKSGGQDANGKDNRVSTMFYPREFVSIGKHIEQQGLASGLGHLAASKSSGLIGLASEWATGVDSFGRQLTDPYAPEYKQLEQKVKATMLGLEPISLQDRGQPQSTKDRALAVAGFNKAPAYVTDTPAEAQIKQTYDKFYATKETSFDKASRSADRKILQQAYTAGDDNAMDKQIATMQEKYQLTGTEVKRMVRSMAKGETGLSSMFQHMSWNDQKRVLKKMSVEEKQKYLPYVSKAHRGEVEDSLP